MSGERTSSSSHPDHFIPLSGEESPLGPETTLFPKALLDVVHLVDPVTGSTETITVLACSGDGIDVVPIDHVEGPVAQEVNAVRVSRHDNFRFVEAGEIDFFRMVGLSQYQDHAGYNDPVLMHAIHSARAAFKGGELEISRYDSRGNLTVGRLDALHAYLESQRPYAQFGQQGAIIGQLTVPTGPLQRLQQGRGVGMAYPMISADTIGLMGNDEILMRVAYDLLVQFQVELRDQGVDHPLVDMVLPVPNRDRLVRELAADGFKIEGDRAIRVGGGSGDTASFLSRLRAMFIEFGGDVVAIPPQGSPDDYIGPIGDLLGQFSTVDDKAVASTMKRIVRDTRSAQVNAPASPAKVVVPSPMTIPEPISVQQVGINRTSTSRPRPRSSRVPPAITISKPPQPDWSGDFSPVTPQNPIRRDDWASDFAEPQEGVSTTTSEDWAADFAAHKPSPESEWADDFK